MNYQTILFDLDGTLTNSYEGITRSVEYALNELGIMVDDREALRCFIGPPLLDSFQEFFHLTPEQAQQAVKAYRARFDKVGWRENVLYCGVEQMLKALYDAGNTLCIASSKPHIFVTRILKYFNIDFYFSHIVAADLSGGLQHKNEIIAAALVKCNADKKSCVMIGDRKFDAQGAAENDVDFIGVCYGFGSKEELMNYPHVLLADDVEAITAALLG